VAHVAIAGEAAGGDGDALRARVDGAVEVVDGEAQGALRLLVALDALLQPTGQFVQLSPSLFVRAQAGGRGPVAPPGAVEEADGPLTPRSE